MFYPDDPLTELLGGVPLTDLLADSLTQSDRSGQL